MRASRRRRPAASRTSDAVRQESYPHPYPTGWYRLSDSASLRPGGLRYIECLGRQLVLWRTEDGAPHVMDAFCPHLGANLSHGRVRGDCIECPFHRWRFTGDGRAAHVPYQTHLPVGPLEQQVDFRWFADRRLPRVLVWYVVGNWISQWARDIEIWENKIYRERPRLCRDDGPVFRLRQWYRQFLPESATAAETTDEPRRADVK